MYSYERNSWYWGPGWWFCHILCCWWVFVHIYGEHCFQGFDSLLWYGKSRVLVSFFPCYRECQVIRCSHGFANTSIIMNDVWIGYLVLLWVSYMYDMVVHITIDVCMLRARNYWELVVVCHCCCPSASSCAGQVCMYILCMVHERNIYDCIKLLSLIMSAFYAWLLLYEGRKEFGGFTPFSLHGAIKGDHMSFKHDVSL